MKINTVRILGFSWWPSHEIYKFQTGIGVVGRVDTISICGKISSIRPEFTKRDSTVMANAEAKLENDSIRHATCSVILRILRGLIRSRLVKYKKVR